MNRRWMTIIGGLVAAGVVIAIAAFAYIWLSGGSGEASEEISAPTLAPRTAVPTVEATEEMVDEATEEPTEAVTEEATEETTEAPTEVAVASDEEVVSNDLLFRIVSEESEVRFILDEELQGRPTNVVGRTDQVAGDILVDRVNPSNSVVGTIRINVRTLVTDQEPRNRMLRSQILESAKDEYEFSEFVPTALEGMPESVAVGDTFEFTIVGDLTLRDITQSVTFTTTVTAVSEEQITGTATAQVLRSDFELQIPRVPGVANVTNEVQLEIDFVADLVTDATE